MPDRNYCRVYYHDLQADYPDVWHDPTALGTYVRLLSMAEAAWPSRPEIPRSTPADALDLLTRLGLLIALPRDCYGIKGLDAERNARRTQARNAARTRFSNADSNADHDADGMPNRAEPNRAKPKEVTPALSAAQKGRRPRANGTNPRAQGTNPRANGTSPRQVLKAEKRDTSVLEPLRVALQAHFDAEAKKS